jgi:hypothetical protein
MQANYASLGLALTAILSLTPGARAQDEDFYDTAVLRTIELTFSQSDYWQQLTNNYASETYIAADLTIDGVVLDNVGVRFKGNSSYNSIGNSQKKPFNIDLNVFADSLGADHDFQGYKKIILNNGFKDPSFVREALTWDICRQFVVAPKSNWVLLVINGESWGIYMNCQHLGDEMLAAWFDEEDGNRYKAEGGPGANPSNLSWLGSSTSLYSNQYQLKNPDDAILPHEDIVELCDVLNNTPGSTFDAIQEVLNVDSALWMLALDNVFVNLDSYYGGGHNYYIFHDFGHDRMETLMWDVNESFGVFLNGLPPGTPPHELPLDFRVTDPGRPLVGELVGDATGWRDFIHHVEQILGEFDWGVMEARAIAYQDLIRAEVHADTKKLYTNNDFDQSLTQDVNNGGGGPGPGGGGIIPGIGPFTTDRANYLLSRPELTATRPTIVDVTVSPSAPTEDDAIRFFVTDVSTTPIASMELLWRIQGAFDRVDLYDDGNHSDGAAGDGVWAVDIPAQAGGATLEYTVRAGAGNGAVTFFPAKGEADPDSFLIQAVGTGELVVNELLADNEQGIVDEMGQTEDWIELYNPGSSAVDLADYTLTDDLGTPDKWTFPSTSVPAGGFLLIWCDDDESDGPLHTNFKLDKDGEAIALYGPVAAGSTLIDAHSFAAQVDDVSEGRDGDGAAAWVAFTTPTPGASNGSAGAGTPYCFGDGSGTACPCANSGGAGEGCATSNGAGAILAASGTTSVSAGNLVLEGSQLVANQPGLYFQGNNAVNSGSGNAFGDGLRCAGGGVVRLQVRAASAAGESATTVDVAAGGGAAAGDLRRYQLWFRDPGSGSPCGNGFNLSNGLELTWAP